MITIIKTQKAIMMTGKTQPYCHMEPSYQVIARLLSTPLDERGFQNDTHGEDFAVRSRFRENRCRLKKLLMREMRKIAI